MHREKQIIQSIAELSFIFYDFHYFSIKHFENI